MQAWAAELATKLPAGTVLALEGDLGAGKTTFTQGLARGLGVKVMVNSPTFVLLKIYKTKVKKFKKLIHLDAYRLNSGADLTAIGWQDYLRPENLVVVEWADRVAAVLPKNSLILKFTLAGGRRRLLTFKKFPQ